MKLARERAPGVFVFKTIENCFQPSALEHREPGAVLSVNPRAKAVDSRSERKSQ